MSTAEGGPRGVIVDINQAQVAIVNPYVGEMMIKLRNAMIATKDVKQWHGIPDISHVFRTSIEKDRPNPSLPCTTQALESTKKIAFGIYNNLVDVGSGNLATEMANNFAPQEETKVPNAYLNSGIVFTK